MTAAPRKKRLISVMEETYPVGSLFKLAGDSWLDTVAGQISLVVGHGYDRFGTLCVFLQLSDQKLDVPYELMSMGDLELVE